MTWGWNDKSASRESVIRCVGEGWHSIVNKLIDDLFDAGWNGVVLQVKEKFGGLRFYIGAGNETMWELIRDAEHRSFQTCEVCGKPGKARHGGWIRTLCDKHAEEMGYDKEE